ncbi:MAG: hypothetical protein HN790_02365 [Methylococcales bacterium]|jgi:hypothetical protein|nr:hypothetical protein [Gammaproteobacteria bacterium]MBT7442795.1 hypothetical protein [Methylococcales bacterium]
MFNSTSGTIKALLIPLISLTLLAPLLAPPLAHAGNMLKIEVKRAADAKKISMSEWIKDALKKSLPDDKDA